MNNIQGGVYQIICKPTEQRYIGCAVNFDLRRRQHFSKLRTKKHINSKMQEAFNKYGEGNFIFQIIVNFGNMVKDPRKGLMKKSYSEANELEIDYTRLAGADKIFNCHNKRRIKALEMEVRPEA